MKHKATKIAEHRCNKNRQDPLNTEDTPVKMHILGAQPDAVAQPTGVKVAHENWFSDGVAASARGELEASGRGSLHGHWELWALAAGRFRDWHDWQWPSHTRSDWRHGGMDY